MIELRCGSGRWPLGRAKSVDVRVVQSMASIGVLGSIGIYARGGRGDGAPAGGALAVHLSGAFSDAVAGATRHARLLKIEQRCGEKWVRTSFWGDFGFFWPRKMGKRRMFPRTQHWPLSKTPFVM